MAVTKKVLGQSKPSATTLTTLYTVPTATSTIVSSFAVCNHSNTTADTVRMSIQVAGEADASKQYIYGGNTASGLTLSVNDTFTSTLGITLSEGDIVKVYSTNGTSSFSLFGVEEA